MIPPGSSQTPFDTYVAPASNSPFAIGGAPSPFETSMRAASMPPMTGGAVPLGSFGLPPTAGPGSTMAFGTGTRSMPVGGNMGMMGQDLQLHVTRLLDMPIEETVLGSTKSYRIVVYDDHDQEVGCSPPIEGLPAREARHREMETISVPHERGTMNIRAETPLIFIEVEHVGGFLGGRMIGRCQIHRMDPRSSQVWPYALSSRDGTPAHCGIELKVTEEGGPPLSAPTPMGSAVHHHRSGAHPASQFGSAANLSGQKLPPSPMSVAADIHHGVSALVAFEKVADIPYPRNERLKELLLSVFADDTEKELRRVGPFLAVDQGSAHQKLGRLAKADCLGASVFVQAPLHFGGEAREGAMYIRVAASYGSTAAAAAASELVGITDAIKVSWVPTSSDYYPLKGRDGHSLGGVYLRCRLLTEAEATAQAQGAPLGVSAPPGRRAPHIGAPVEPLHRVSGRTGNFPPGSQEEAYEQAAINAEAQNRALLQRCKIADPKSHENNPHVKVVNGYREWDSLDSVFSTMGPNPLAMSEEVGPTVARSYQEFHTALKELKGKLPTPHNFADEQLNMQLIRQLYLEDPGKVISALRPVMCKDPEEIADAKDMSWCPDPPVYAPLRNMHEEDRETLRLACYAPEQDAKLCFADVNPNYRINDDVWGVLADYKTARSRMVQKPVRQHRVKDDCIMA